MSTIYKSVKEFFIPVDDVYTPEYISFECGKLMSREALKKYFNKNIKKHDIHKHREMYLEKCTKTINILAESTRHGGDFWKILYSTVTSERVFNLERFHFYYADKLEIFLNITFFFLGTFYLPWTAYILIFPSGQKLVKDLFQKPNIVSYVNFYCILYSIQTTKEFDTYFFKEQVMKLIPYVDFPELVVSQLNLPVFLNVTTQVVSGSPWYRYFSSHLPTGTSQKVGRMIDEKIMTTILQKLAVLLHESITEMGGTAHLMDALKGLEFNLKKTIPKLDSIRTSIARSVSDSVMI